MNKMNSILLLCVLFGSTASLLEFNLTQIKQSPNSREQTFDWTEENGNLLESLLKRIPVANLFSIEIRLGTPGQLLNVLVDTGSFLLWVANEDSIDRFPIPHHFKPRQSSTYKNLAKTFSIQYATGECSGFLASDVLSTFSTSLTIEWGLADKTNSNFRCDGIIGFGRKFAPAGYSDSQNLLAVLMKEKAIDKQILSIKIDKADSSNSKMFIGDYQADFNQSNKDHIGFCKLSESHHWICRMSYVVFGDSSIGNFKQNAVSFYYPTVFDSGSNVSSFPIKAFDQFNKHFPTDICQATGVKNVQYVIICTEIPNIPDISFVFNGYSIKVLPSALFLKEEFKNSYLFTIVFWNQPLYLIGMPFFYNAHLLFDNELGQMKFYVDDLKNIVNVSQYTTDDDFLISENPWVIILIVVGCIAVIGVAIAIYFFIKKQKQKGLLEALNNGKIAIE